MHRCSAAWGPWLGCGDCCSQSAAVQKTELCATTWAGGNTARRERGGSALEITGRWEKVKQRIQMELSPASGARGLAHGPAAVPHITQAPADGFAVEDVPCPGPGCRAWTPAAQLLH